MKDRSGLTGNGMADQGAIGPDQDGFNVESHKTNFAENDMLTKPQVGRDQASATDKRGAGGTMGDDKK